MRIVPKRFYEEFHDQTWSTSSSVFGVMVSFRGLPNILATLDSILYLRTIPHRVSSSPRQINSENPITTSFKRLPSHSKPKPNERSENINSSTPSDPSPRTEQQCESTSHHYTARYNGVKNKNKQTNLQIIVDKFKLYYGSEAQDSDGGDE